MTPERPAGAGYLPGLVVSLALVAHAPAPAQMLVDGLAGATAVLVSPDGAHVYVAGRDDDALVTLRRDAATGALSFVEALLNDVDVTEGLDGAAALAITADGTSLFVAGSSSRLATFARDPASGRVTQVASVPVERSRGVPGLAVTPDGRRVYQTMASRPMELAALGREGAADALEIAQTVPLADKRRAGSAGIVLSPDGRSLYIAASGFRDGFQGLYAFRVDALDGTVAPAEAPPVVDEYRGASLAISPDGAHVYAVFYDRKRSPTVRLFARDPATSALDAVDAPIAASPEPTGSGQAAAIRVSPDGAHVYVAAGRPGSVVAFARDAATGRLRFVEAFAGEGDTAAALRRAAAITTAPDGRHVYVASRSAVAAFARDAASGRLRFVDAVFDEVGCGRQPLPACRDAGRRSVLTVRDRSAGAGALSWTWRGTEGAGAGFGDPRDEGSRYWLCAYADDGLLERRDILGCTDCWGPEVNGKLRYREAVDDPRFVGRARLRRRGNDRVDIDVRLRGESLYLLDLPAPLPLRVQLQTRSGACFEARYTAASTTVNRRHRLRARSVR
jgi:6-phosphogluconolactonase (cycloisomerase 2 family)